MASAFLLILLGGTPANARDYDPLQLANDKLTPPIDLSIRDRRRDRDIPIRVYLPHTKRPAPVILFSHGLGGSRRACGYCGKHWSARGYTVIAMQHTGSDESVWKYVPLRERLDALRKSTTFQATKARFEDVKTVIDQIEEWNTKEDHQFHGRFDLENIGMSGHSYGAATTQGVSGQSSPLLGQRFTDRRIAAALMFSPNSPRMTKPDDAFGKVAIPWMLMTGTKDTSPINDTTVADRRRVYPALPQTIDRYELVLENAEHHAFGDGEGRRRNRNPNHHRVILALSTAFWDTKLRGDDAARGWLHGDGPKSIMAEKDLWQLALGKQDSGSPQSSPDGP
ncbi:MAG TPA: dienelactone hydrolase [Planctomycetaceae bacterium]|nr:dienelactone hydrolase [Planctomycetaceae bacterium]